MNFTVDCLITLGKNSNIILTFYNGIVHFFTMQWFSLKGIMPNYAEAEWTVKMLGTPNSKYDICTQIKNEKKKSKNRNYSGFSV